VRKIGGRIEQKGLENLAKSSAAMVDPSNLGQPPRTKCVETDPELGR